MWNEDSSGGSSSRDKEDLNLIFVSTTFSESCIFEHKLNIADVTDAQYEEMFR